ncbi:MAG TPA: POTRA domain-containing protein, partial [Polyangium sp.]|nr:POTRA domain-containing protein [Polyangium sp.]
QTGQFARISAEAVFEVDGVVVRLHVLPRRIASSVQLVGATLDRSATLDAARIRDGSEITEPAITEITERVRRYYADHGHPAATVTFDLAETDVADHIVLRIIIDPGVPRTIRRRIFQVKQVMLREVGELPSKYRLTTGARIDEPLLVDADRDLAETLRDNGFLRAQVQHEIRETNAGSDLYVIIDPGPRIIPVFEGNHAIDDVELAFTINQVKGLDLKTQDLIDKLLRFYAERGFFDATIKAEERGGPEDPVHHIVLTIDEGAQVRVAKRVFPCLPKTWKPEQMEREINSFLLEELPGEKGFALRDPNAALSLVTQPSASRPVAKPLDLNPVTTYAPETYDRALKHLRDLVFSKGYLHAAIGPVTIDRATCDPRSRAAECVPLPLPNIAPKCALDEGGLPVPEPEPPAAATCHPDAEKHVECSRDIALRIPMNLGPQTILYDVGFEGSRVFSEKQMFDLTQLELGKPLSTIALEAARLRLLDAYRNRGFAYAEVSATIESSPDKTRARARFAVTERDQVTVGGFVVRGALRTSEELILRRVTLVAGGAYVEREARTSEQRIGALGAFSSVSVGLEDPEVPQKQKRVIITVTEQIPQYLDPRVGFSTGEGLRFAVEYGHRNIAGLAITLTLRVQLAYLFDFIVLDQGVRRDYERLTVARQLERRNTVSVNFPEVGFSPLMNLSIDGIDVRDNQRGFGISRQALVPTLAYRPSRTITMRLGGSAEVNEIDVFNASAVDSPLIPLLRYPKGQSVAFAGRFNFAWDGRNNAFAATKGGLVALGVEYVRAIPFGEDKSDIESNFLRFSGRTSGYFELTSKGPSVALSLAAG